MEIVQTKPFNRDSWKTSTEVPIAKGREVTYPFQWLLFKPQLHAIEPFETNKTTRDNTVRSQTTNSKRTT